MALFGLVFFVVALVLIGAGFAIGLVACLVAAVLLGLGVTSSSFLVGIWTGRTSAAIRVFLLQCGLLAGIPAGAICAWLGHEFLKAYGAELPVLFYGALGGAVAGLVVALALDFISRRAHMWLLARALPSNRPAPQAILRGP